MISQFFAYIQMQEKNIFYFGELQKVFNISSQQEKDLLSNLSRRGMIIRLKRGVYLVPQKIPPGGKWQPDSLYLISQFMKVIGAKYYIGGLYAFHHYGLTNQLVNEITIYNDRLSGKKRLGNLNIQLIKIASPKIGEPVTLSFKEKEQVNISRLSRTILDAIKDWSRFNTLPTAFEWIKNNIQDYGFLSELVNDTIMYGNMSSKRRIGYFLYKQTHDKKLVEPILKKLTASKSWLPLDPQGGTKGLTKKEWRIIDNVHN
ncbi:MAG: hypothetical protein H0U71_05140 [Gammaproteobacteria bacterium]|nr:hypothetical protein [Gammaproteobacteria bacterium]